MTKTDYSVIKDIWFSMSVDERFTFIENNIIIPTPKGQYIPLVMTGFQKKWFLDGPLFNDFTKMTKFTNRICLKIRNVGASLVMIGVEATLTAWIYPGVFIPFVSATEGQAIDLLKHCKNLIGNARFDVPLQGGLEGQTMTTLTFANGTMIRSFSSRPQGIRGGRALVAYIDEMAFINNPQEVLSAVEYFLTSGGQLNILSTPYGKTNRFWQIYSDRQNYTGWKRHHISLFDNMDHFDINMPLQLQIQKYNVKMTCSWLSIDFLEKKRKDDKPFNYMNFLQEAVGIPMSENTSAITEEVLDANSMEEYYLYERPLDGEGKPDKERIFIMSADFGADKNVTALVVTEAKDGRFVVCYIEAFNGDYNEQLKKVKDAVRRFKPKIFIGDATGMGGVNWMAHLSTEIDVESIIPFNYAKKDYAIEAGVDMNNKNYMVVTAIKYMSQGLIIVPKNHFRLREELLGMEKIVYENIIKYTGKNGPAGSDDLAFSALQNFLMFDRIYSYDEENVIGSVNYNWGKKKISKFDKIHQPTIHKTEFTESSSAKSGLGASSPLRARRGNFTSYI